MTARSTLGLVYPHQLFSPHPVLSEAKTVLFVEEPLFFTQFQFHRQKLMLHRASMRSYRARLESEGIETRYLESSDCPRTESVVEKIRKLGFSRAVVVDPCDDWLSQRLRKACEDASVTLAILEDPHFLTPKEEIARFTTDKKKLFFTNFYIAQRQRLGILVEKGKPVGGKWSFDPENRKKLPASVTPPAEPIATASPFADEARAYVEKHFPNAPGAGDLRYPVDHVSARAWLADFVRERLPGFGDYEDAMSRKSATLFHSVLTPTLNVGLLSPVEVVEAALGEAPRTPLNSLEGFLRQVIGWREYVRLVYLTQGRRQRSHNFWKMKRRLPPAFYDGTTGIEPVDAVIRSVVTHGYCHHIERLMILGNFMLLCGVEPDGVYQWFMEMFVDAYDWVMVPNVYGMSQHADGGIMTTKPYISGSAYVLKMSDFKKGDWCAVWDALYWSFIDEHADFFRRNPRMMVMVKMRDKLGEKMKTHRKTSRAFLERLHG